MRMPARIASVALLAAGLCGMTTPALAAGEPEAWTPTATALRAPAAGIVLPQTVGDLSLAKSGEASNGGRAIDNYAQYLSEDGEIQATLYVYMPTYADAALAAYMTDKAIMARFGSKTRRTAYASAPVGGQPGRAIRAVYDDAADGALTTAAGFVHAGRWIVKLRVTGPTARRAEVVAGLDAMLANLAVDDPATLHAATPVRFAQCPASDTAQASLAPAATGETAPPRDVGIPRDGQDSLCVRGTIATADGRFEMLQQAGRADGPIIVPMDDSGTLLALDPAQDGAGYRLSIHMVGQTDLYGTYDRAPNAAQVAAIIDGTDPQTAQAAAVAAYAANGDVTVRRASTTAVR
ncbi:hypothetical protein SAMIE_1015000 [Sphingobium amiense]|uniref:Uncharacterized protein n=2 Tax=Sphingobium amiense TaxID=135719 RepID=A0A494WCH7_9SPHN|nr:hypothetical protein SAMIE_1015000 [Sphingobium amiense]